MHIYISGLNSGSSPFPGVGTARSLRSAYPNATIVGVVYSHCSPGAHWSDFDEVFVQPSWNVLNLDEFKQQIEKILHSGAFWISGLGFETLWLALTLPNEANLLIPPLDALNKVGKPAISVQYDLPMKIPPFVSCAQSDWDIYAFCRKYGWQVLLKGPLSGARRIRNWNDLNSARHELTQRWPNDELFLQAHITGYEETIALSAYHGRMLGCVYMSKHDNASGGKTEAGHIADVPEGILRPFHNVVAYLNWTGGAELRFIRDEAGVLWLLEWNPRFPAWIYGATLAGQNLPGLLLEHITGAPAKKPTENYQRFTSVVLEIPVHSANASLFPPKPIVSSFDSSSREHPSHIPMLAKKLQELSKLNTKASSDESDIPSLPSSIIQDIATFNFTQIQTPCRLFLKTTAESLFKSSMEFIHRVNNQPVTVAIAYSVKTNPDDRLIELAHHSGFLAEVISQLEVQKVLSKGFSPGRLVLNGPGKWWPAEKITAHTLRAIFCDSTEELRQVISQAKGGKHLASVIGVRLRSLGFYSRFGISMEAPEIFEELASLISMIPSEYSLGVHFHGSSIMIGTQRWWHFCREMLQLAKSIEEFSARKIECLDIGGGWFPDDWTHDLEPHFEHVLSWITELLPAVKELILEPGRALSQPTMALAMRVLEVRRQQNQVKEVVVDGSITELPKIDEYPHRILLLYPKTNRWQYLGRGEAQITGRLCMENDFLATNIGLPENIDVGDFLIVNDAGAYDKSMSYTFGHGT